MSFKVQATSDVAIAESTSKAYVGPSSMQRVSKLGKETGLEQLWKEEKPQDGLKEVPTKAEVESAVESINNAIEHISRALRFSIHEDTQRVMVKVIDVNTDEVIKELPPEAVLDTAARIREMIGLLIDERA